ncbi:Response regulator receiver domain-containing protein [Rheinheimera pacifica]|uniref:Response regulator receiver domain-containing protein n=1 Tax=Rheinheimera pacifica TaxID=173990 RepID=A0A1H6KH71_9GAMM|nr:response regulator [Rheinheimera pacifica]SEH72631.1 Response regulator receiver domain-containing protein [Rheinheimera pacifica]
MQKLDGTRAQIAIVDDDFSVRAALGNLLRSVNYKTLLFESAEAVLQSNALREISFMVLDVKLKGISGIELFERLRAAEVNIPTAFISGNAGLNTQLRIARAGAVLFLSKPVDVELLLRTIDDTLNAIALP